MSNHFVHLNIHSEYSLIDGIVRLKELTKQACDQQMPALAITDQMNLFALVKAYKLCRAAGIKLIVGASVYLANPADPKKPFSAILLCQNNQGYHHLTELISRAYTDGQQHDKAIIEPQWLEQKQAGLLLLSGAQAGDVGQALINGNAQAAEKQARYWQQLFPDRYYLELQRVGAEHEKTYLPGALALAKKLQLPVVATNAVCFLQRDDFYAHEARVAIHDGYTLDDPRRPKKYTAQQYLRNSEEMASLFADIPSALENATQISLRCNVTLSLNEVHLPNFPVPEGMTIEAYFAEQAKQGLEKRLAILFDTATEEFVEQRKVYDERLDTELGVINQMGFPGYFLIVADFIRWALDNGVPVGPGRGSGAGSLVAYSLNITDLDPLKYDLLFERFLNPERVSMPDFDIDFCMVGRDKVIDYVGRKYGRDAVSQIITYGRMAAKAVVRDVGRILGHPYGFVDKLAKLIPFDLGITLDKALAQEEPLRERYNEEEDVTALFDLAKKLEGITRNVGKHAGGVVIAPSTLSDYVPVYCESGESAIVSQFDKDDVEAVGLVKFDFLGLRTLTIIDWAVKNIQASCGKTITINQLPLDDEKAFVLLKACQTTAVFQLESRGMKDLIKRLEPDCFEEIVALVALFRPGPLQSGMVDDFIDRKHGRAPIEYPHPDLEQILQPTYGVILYQEQVMQIAQVLAGFTLGAADLLRRAMGKKKAEEMAKQRLIFVDGATKRGVEKKTATGIFDLMEKFAGYGFNKSHSAAYALLSYQTAWLKAHYPAEFMAAVLSSDMDNTDKVVGFVEDARAQGVKVIPPAINSGAYQFTVSDKGEIIYGLGAIKGVGSAALDDVIAQRKQHGDYQSLFDFCQRVDLRKVNRRVLEALIRSGGFDSFGQHRAVMFASVNKALQHADQYARNQERGQGDLFSDCEQTMQMDYLPALPWSERERLDGEKATLGLYISGHPVARYQRDFAQMSNQKIAKLTPYGTQTVTLAGMVLGARTVTTRRGKKMAILTLDDGSGRIDIVAFSDLYEQKRELFVKDTMLVVTGEVSADEFSGGIKMRAEEISRFAELRQRLARGILFTIDEDQANDDIITALQQRLQELPVGNCPIYIDYVRADSRSRFNLGKQWQREVSDALFEAVEQILGKNRSQVIYQ